MIVDAILDTLKEHEAIESGTIDMSVSAKILDLDDATELARLADEVSATRQPIVLRRHGRALAVLSPLATATPFAPGRTKTPADHEAFLRSAGAWVGNVDEDVMDEIYRSRTISTRTPVEL